MARGASCIAPFLFPRHVRRSRADAAGALRIQILWPMLQRPRLTLAIGIAVALLIFAPAAGSYSVLSHEEIVDLAWKDHIAPALLKRFPNATPEDLKNAHAYAYGGCLIQDMGYYPHGNKRFSDLVHYVRSGDFVTALLRQSHTLDEYAFALGALAHYVSDTQGHPAVNRSVALDFPKLSRKYGPSVTYDEDHSAHIRTEFGFDVVQVAQDRFTSDAYHNFIGFAIAKESLARAFRDTYGFDIGDILTDEDQTIGSFRWAVKDLIPELTRVALKSRKKQIMAEYPTFDRKKFLYHLSRAEYEREWGANYFHPSFRARFIAFLLRILPKIGPLKAFDIKNPTPQTEQLYLKSMNTSVEMYDRLVDESTRQGITLANMDFDTGKPTRPGEYRLCDETYAYVLHKLAKDHFQTADPVLRSELLRFYARAQTAPKFQREQDRKDWEQLQKDLAELRTAAASKAAQAEQP